MKYDIPETFSQTQQGQGFLTFHEKIREMVNELNQEGRDEVIQSVSKGSGSFHDVTNNKKGTFDTYGTGIRVKETNSIVTANTNDSEVVVMLYLENRPQIRIEVSDTDLSRLDPKVLMDIVEQYNPDEPEVSEKLLKDWMAGNPVELV